MSTSISANESMANPRSLLIPIPKGGVLAEEGDSLLQLLALTAYWGKSSKTGRELWSELRRIIDITGGDETKQPNTKGLGRDLNAKDWTVDSVREEVANAERALAEQGLLNPTETALQVATQTSSVARVFRLERLRQVRWIFGLTFGSAVLGVLLMAIGVFTHVNMVVLGAFVEFITGALLLLYRTSTRQLDSEAEVSFALERLRLGIALIHEIKDTAVRDQALRSLIRDVHEHPTTIVAAVKND
jgi:hypothetical protein